MAKVIVVDGVPVLRDDWHIEDIMAEAFEVLEKQITEADAVEIMRRIAKAHDAEVGINWEVIRTHIEIYIDDKKGESK